MHALEKLGDGRKDKGYENGESKGDQDDASEIESADHDDGYDHAEKSRQVFIFRVTGHCYCAVPSSSSTRKVSGNWLWNEALPSSNGISV